MGHFVLQSTQYHCRLAGGHYEADALLGRRLADHQHAGASARYRAKGTGCHTRHANHPCALNGDQTQMFDSCDGFHCLARAVGLFGDVGARVIWIKGVEDANRDGRAPDRANCLRM